MGLLDFLWQGQGGGLLPQQPPQPQATPPGAPTFMSGLVDYFRNNPATISALAAGIGSAPSMRQGIAQAAGGMPQAMGMDQQRQGQQALSQYFQNPSNAQGLNPGQMQLLSKYPALAEKYALQSMTASPAGAPTVQEFFDQQTGQKYKAQYNKATGQWDRVGGTEQTKPTGTFHTLTDPTERVAAGIDPADKGVYQQDDTTKRVYSVGNSGGLLGGQINSDDVTSVADGIETGDIPPDMKSYYKYKVPVTAELQRRGVNLSEMQTDWTATQKHYAALNSTAQTRLRQNIETVKGTLQTVRQLAEEWKAGGYPLLNAANRQAALQGVLGPDANRIVSLLGAQIADVTGEMGSVLMGGNSPTDHAMELAAQNLSADWSYPTLTAALDQFDKNITFRQNAIANTGTAGVPNSNYNYGNNAADLPPATSQPAPVEPGVYEYDPATKSMRRVQ